MGSSRGRRSCRDCVLAASLVAVLAFVGPMVALVPPPAGAQATGAAGEDLSSPADAPAASKVSLSTCPSYWLLGAMKCGSTTLNQHMLAHFPELHQKRKEYNVFGVATRPKLSRYGRNHSDTASALDASPKYLHYPRAARQIAKMCTFGKAPRFVVTLCDPASRAWSHYRHRVAFGHQPRPKEGLARGFERFVARRAPRIRRCASSGQMYTNDRSCSMDSHDMVLWFSLYSQQLKQWMRVFPRTSFLILDLEDWTLHLEQAVSVIGKHFGLTPRRLGRVNGALRIDHGSIGSREVPGNHTWQALRDLYMPHGNWKGLVTWLGTTRAS